MSMGHGRGRAAGIAALACLTALGLAACDLFLGADERVQRADAHIAAHDYRAAVIELKNALQDEPTHVTARLRLAQVELQLGDAPSAERDLRRALDGGADARANAELLARVQLALGQERELLAGIDSGKVALQGSARALYRGRAALALQSYDAALADFAAVPVDDARHAEARVGFAETLAAQGKGAEALAELDALVARSADLIDAWLAIGAIQARRGNFADAARALQRARALVSPALNAVTRAKLLAGLCEVQLAQGDTAAAGATHAELAALAPEAIVTHVLAARIAMARQDYAAAVAGLQRTLAVAPDVLPIRFLLGAALVAQGNLGQAELHLSQVVERAPENLEARKLLVQTRLRRGRSDAALQALSAVENIDDTQLDVLRGLTYLQMGEGASGVAYLERVAAAEPANSRLKLDLAAAYLRAGAAERVLPLLEQIPIADRDLRFEGMLIAAYEANARPREAQTEVERVLAARPREPAALELGAAWFAQRRDFVRARALAQRAVAADPKRASALLVCAGIELQAGDVAAAEHWLGKALAVEPRNVTVLLGLARLAAQRGDFAAAVRPLEEMRKQDAAAIEPRLRLIALYLRQRNAAAAQPVIAEVAALGKDRPEVLNALGQLLLDSGRYDEALLRFQAAAMQDSANPTYWLNSARAQIALGNSAVAHEALERALAAQPGWLPAVAALAMLDLREGHGPEALKRVSELAAARPRDGAALTLRGDVQMILKDFPKAAASYAAAGALRPTAVLALKTHKARESGNLPRPLEPLLEWLAAHPEDDSTRMVLAEAYRVAGERASAVRQYETIRAAGRANAVLLNNLAWVYYELDDARAEPTAREAHERAPSIAAMADTYGWILAEKGKSAEAVDVLKRAAAEGGDPSIEYHYAVALIRSGSGDEGRKRLAALLERSPRFPEAADARRLLGLVSGP